MLSDDHDDFYKELFDTSPNTKAGGENEIDDLINGIHNCHFDKEGKGLLNENRFSVQEIKTIDLKKENEGHNIDGKGEPNLHCHKLLGCLNNASRVKQAQALTEANLIIIRSEHICSFQRLELVKQKHNQVDKNIFFDIAKRKPPVERAPCGKRQQQAFGTI